MNEKTIEITTKASKSSAADSIRTQTVAYLMLSGFAEDIALCVADDIVSIIKSKSEQYDVEVTVKDTEGARARRMMPDSVSPPKENRLTMKAVKEAIDPANGPDMFKLYMLQAKAMMDEAKKVRAVKCPKCVHYKMKYGSSGGETYKVCHRCARDTWGKVDAHPDMFKEAESDE